MKIRYSEYEYEANQSANRVESNAASSYATVHEVNNQAVEKSDREHKGYILKTQAIQPLIKSTAPCLDNAKRLCNF